MGRRGVAHGNRPHLGQQSFWNNVSEGTHDVDFVPMDAVQDLDGPLTPDPSYVNYRLDVQAVLTLLETRFRQLDTGPRRSGFQQMLASFEDLPEERRRTAIGDAIRRLKEVGAGPPDEAGSGDETRTNSPPWVASEELRDRVTRIGLKAYYSQSSARTKAEMAPLMEELQGMMEGGRIRRGPRRPSTPGE